MYLQIKAYVDKNAKNGQEYAQQELRSVTLPSSFSTTFDPWSVITLYIIVCIKLIIGYSSVDYSQKLLMHVYVHGGPSK